MTDCGPPSCYGMLKVKPKRLQLQKERTNEIQTHNQILLNKMLQIDLKPSHLHPTMLVSSLPPSHGTLNRVVRYKELTKITCENRALLRRIQSSKSSYNHKKWIEDETLR
eukprot:CAMPEP_0201283216 /NCGR_PEP_ID=MMETSP1317-20130820/7962_1 /ASSEMBLY_ACC=CAM_ASM_000770 /TAXON_ID=187299 /ORGANISM="Undescribed Undescribed, Strain Undescribed" /LENGTH=109 /DNA_ID=CAMNT_0047598719 /DNA_START=106 /DNA_END=435 /DNA_ORIENTATION=-